MQKNMLHATPFVTSSAAVRPSHGQNGHYNKENNNADSPSYQTVAVMHIHTIRAASPIVGGLSAPETKTKSKNRLKLRNMTENIYLFITYGLFYIVYIRQNAPMAHK